MHSHPLAFIILFSVTTLVVYHGLVRQASSRWSNAWLLAASLFFYACFQPRALALLIGSALFNYAVGARLSRDAEHPPRALLMFGIGGNLLLLAFFKYAMDAQHYATSLWPAFQPIQILLPLGLSFYTFSQLNYLMEASAGLARPGSFSDYLLFVSFFPYVSSGPIVRYSDIAPQFQEKPDTDRAGRDLCVGLTLLAIGFFKKTVLGDGISLYVQPVFENAARGAPVHFIEAWFGGISYVLELYFDFSGYSDMAIGAARMFGIHVPVNFNSPYKAENISEFWLRWHMTLTQFLTNYVYNPMVLMLTRRRQREGKKAGDRARPWTAFWATAAFPMMITMILIGLWHGSTMTFLIFGILNGLYLIVNHAWHILKRPWTWIALFPAWFRMLIAHALTGLAVLVAFICFNATQVSTLRNLLAGMLGLHGLAVPAVYEFRLQALLHAMPRLHVEFITNFMVPVVDNSLWIAVLLAIVWACPNSQEWLSLEAPAGASPKTGWKPSIPYALGVGIVCSMALWCAVTTNRLTEFIYFNF